MYIISIQSLELHWVDDPILLLNKVGHEEITTHAKGTVPECDKILHSKRCMVSKELYNKYSLGSVQGLFLQQIY